jgi:MoaA/NifB/PqqE/SkfB family radical SAM enzyme
MSERDNIRPSPVECASPSRRRRAGLVSWELAGTWARNLWRLHGSDDPVLEPFVTAWFCTYRCNLSCSYCILAEKGWTRGGQPELDHDGARRLLAIIRRACPNLYISGGEPLLRKDLRPLLEHALTLDFASISMVTNMSLMHRQPELLELVDNLVVSLDMLDEARCAQVLGCRPAVVRRIRSNVEFAASRQRELGFRMAANFVITPQSLGDVHRVLDFCRAHGIRLTVGPELSFDGHVSPDLREDPRYPALLQELLCRRDTDPAILDSRLYLETLRDQAPFPCFPSLTPRISPMGGLYYPCRPIGGLEIDLLAAGSFAEAVQEGQRRYGPAPRCRGRCPMNCYTTPSLFMTNPVSTLWDHARAALRGLGARPCPPASGEAGC